MELAEKHQRVEVLGTTEASGQSPFVSESGLRNGDTRTGGAGEDAVSAEGHSHTAGKRVTFAETVEGHGDSGGNASDREELSKRRLKGEHELLAVHLKSNVQLVTGAVCP